MPASVAVSAPAAAHAPTLEDGVGATEGVLEGDAPTERLDVTDGVLAAVLLREGELEGEGEDDDEEEDVCEFDADDEADGDAEGDSETDGVDDAVADGEAPTEMDADGVCEALPVAVVDGSWNALELK